MTYFRSEQKRSRLRREILAAFCVNRSREIQEKASYIADIQGFLLSIGVSFCPLWSGKRDSDPRPQPWQGCALPTELFPQLLFSDGRETASAPRLRASKPAFRDCKYKPKNLFCKIFRRILSQNYSCAARKRKKETPVQMRSRRHARRQRPAANGNKNKAAGNGSLIYIRIALRANPD